MTTTYLPRRRVLVIANETVESELLERTIRSLAAGRRETRVLVVAPALNSRFRHWVSDSDSARDAAEERLIRCLDRLALAGIDANGLIGDSDPLQAITDALHVFGADQIVIATHPEHRSNWLARRLVDRVERRYSTPVLHIVVDSERRTEYVRDRGGGRATQLVRGPASV